MTDKVNKPWAIVVGAGPSGLLLALMLAKRSIPVLVLEASAVLDDSPRAAYYGPPAAYELQRAGVLDEIRKGGFDPVVTCWRKLDGTYLAGWDATVTHQDVNRLACMPLAQLDQLLYRRAMAEANVDVLFNHKVINIGQDEGKAWIEVETPEGKKRFESEYVVGCDGGSSTVRKQLLGSGDQGFPGWTWDKQIVATNVSYPFKKLGYEDVQFIIDREHWHMVARLTKSEEGPDWWRVSYGEISGLSREELIARQPWKFEQMLPGHPKPEEYNLAAISPYKIHQRIVDKMRVGRICLAADAAHLCNPFGGMGLTGGIVDVGGLYDCLAGIFEGKADPDILDKYSEIRRQKYKEIIDPMSQSNIRRLYDQEPDEALEKDEFLQLLKRNEGDVEAQKVFLRSSMSIQYDFTQHYKDGTGKAKVNGHTEATDVKSAPPIPDA